MSLSYQDRFAEDNVVEDVIAEEIENIWKHVSRSISDKWLSTLDIPLSAEIAMLKMRKIVAWATFEHDGVIPAPIEGDDGEFIFDKLTPDGEPAPITIDPWARGTGTAKISTILLQTQIDKLVFLYYYDSANKKGS